MFRNGGAGDMFAISAMCLYLDKYIQEFYEDMDALKVERATYEPRATDYIPQIIQMVQTLVDKGHAYPLNGDVYFSIERFSGYGKQPTSDNLSSGISMRFLEDNGYF